MSDRAHILVVDDNPTNLFSKPINTRTLAAQIAGAVGNLNRTQEV